jgi:hypothetical protein
VKTLALSTMYAQQERFADGGVFARYAAAAGYDAIEVSHSTPPGKLQQILDAGVLPVTSVHLPAPWVRHADGRGNADLNLASLDAAEVETHRESIAAVARTGALRVVVHLGQVTDEHGPFAEERELRAILSANAGDPRAPELRATAIAKRAAAAEAHVAAARQSLLELVRVAEPEGIAIGVETRFHYHEIPHPREFEVILEGVAPEQAGYWHDVGHAEVLHRLGFIDRHAWLGLLTERCVGAHVHDVRGPASDHQAPGAGDVDWAYVAAGLGRLHGLTIEINQWQPDEGVSGAPGFLRSAGLG